MDALSEVLRLVRLTGAVFLNAELSAPWVAVSPTSAELAAAILPEAEYMIEYHLILGGRCFIATQGGTPLALETGDLVMLPHGDAHRMSSDLAGLLAPVPAEEINIPLGQGVTAHRHDGGGDPTRLVCGYLAIDRRVCGALIEALPRVLHVRAGASEVSGWLQSYLRIQLVQRADEQPGGASVLAKLSELMFVEAIRRYVDALPPGQCGWLAGLKDPFVGKALGQLHSSPVQAWTVDRLARAVGLSRSALAERFTALMGKSPIQYLTQWRLTLAAHLLRTTIRPASSIALEVGYESEGAFNKAFKREFGTPPATWRRAASRKEVALEPAPALAA